MAEERTTSTPPKAPAEPFFEPSSAGGGAGKIPLELHLKNLGVQAVFGILVGLIALIVLLIMGSEGAVARGGAVIFALIGLWSARSLIHWPIPRPLIKAQSQLPANVKAAETGGREILETIVFVVVLVLILKSFAAEAFVIPTGSMAETLYGYQKIVTCPSCGHEFAVNASNEVDPQEGRPRQRITRCGCPNCRRRIHLIDPDVDGRPPREGRQFEGEEEYLEIRDPKPTTGDRVIVGKFLYDGSLPFLSRPNRLDVVVFKYPEGPQKNHSALNYIKRLVGLPGETIAIYGGDLYVLPPELSPTYDDTETPLVQRWMKKFTHEDDEVARKLWDQGKFRIIHKPPRVLLSMMRLVYDNDFQASDLKGQEWQRWQPEGKAWEPLDGGKSFRHGHPADSATTFLRYHHLLRGPAPKRTLITDFMGYNSEGDSGVNWVGDLVMECEVKVEKAEGSLTLELVRAGERFQATWDLASDDGICTLTRTRAEGKVETLESAATPLRKGTYRLRLANVDRRLTVWVDNNLPFGDGVSYTPPSEPGPRQLDLEPAGIAVKGTAVTVQHLRLFRDSYYTRGSARGPNDPDAELREVDWGDSRTWKKLRELEPKTLYVQPGHYLCLGDNSPASSDGRSWGLVPERLLLGRALVVYYPFYAPFWPFESPVNRLRRIR